MPELPEVETVARGLNKFIVGETVRSVEVLRKDSIGYPEVDVFKRLLKGHTFEKTTRRGKYIIIGLSNNAALVVHLRMSGRLVLKDESQSAGAIKTAVSKNFLRVRILLESGRELHYEDMRVFGRLWYVPAGSSVDDVVGGIASLGVEPLSHLTAEYMLEAFRGKNQPIKNALLDQRIIAGIGNIYADESLFLANINPLQPAGKLKLEQLVVLSKKIVEVLSRSIELGGTTLRDYANLSGVNGDYQNAAHVYGRTNEKCSSCGTKIERVKLAGRSSHFCPKCQPVSSAIRKAHEAAASVLKESQRQARESKIAKQAKTRKGDESQKARAPSKRRHK
jgi:formamidopyrimidine-DNA glycosylase